MPDRPLPKHREIASRRRDERLHTLQATHTLLQKVRAEHARALEEATRYCSLREIADVLGLTRSGVQHYRNAIRAGRNVRPPEGKTREAL